MNMNTCNSCIENCRLQRRNKYKCVSGISFALLNSEAKNVYLRKHNFCSHSIG